MSGERRRGLTVLKMRGSMRDKDIREFTIDHQGMRISQPFWDVTGILAGNRQQMKTSEIDRLNGLFREDN